MNVDDTCVPALTLQTVPGKGSSNTWAVGYCAVKMDCVPGRPTQRSSLRAWGGKYILRLFSI